MKTSTFMRAVLITLALLICHSFSSYATDFTYEGIKYTIIDQTAKTCKTKDGMIVRDQWGRLEYTKGNDVSGNIAIPPKVYYDTEEYTVTEIGYAGFVNCSELLSIEIPATITVIGYGAFESCRSLDNLYLNDISAWYKTNFVGDNSNPVKIVDNVFLNKDELTHLIIPDDITTINDAFSGCKNILSVTLHNSVKSIDKHAFSDCVNLRNIDIPESVTNIDYCAFAGCKQLKEIYIPNSVKSLGFSAFEDCDNLQKVSLSQALKSLVSSTFKNCTSLKSIIIPNSVTSIGSSVFSGCSSLKSLAICGKSVKIESDAFTNCKLLKVAKQSSVTLRYGSCTITLPDEDFSIKDNCLYSKDLSALYYVPVGNETSFSIPNTVAGIGDYAFGYCESITSLSIPASLNNIGSHAFEKCGGIVKLELSDLSSWCKVAKNDHPFRLSQKGEIFLNGIRVTSIEWPRNVPEVDNSFNYCTGINSITFPDGVSEIGENAFDNCTDLKNVVFPQTIKGIGDYAFNGCLSLQSINLPSGLTNIGNHAFSNCTGLNSVKLSNCLTSIGDYAFSGCSGLTSVKLSNCLTSIGDYAFSGCSGLTSFVIPESVTSIGEYAFEKCSGIPTLTIHKNLNKIGTFAFWGMSNLKTLILLCSEFNLGSIYKLQESCRIYCNCVIYDKVKDYFKGKVSLLNNYEISCQPLICGTKVNIEKNDIEFDFPESVNNLSVIRLEDNVTVYNKSITESGELIIDGLVPDKKYKLVYSWSGTMSDGETSIDFTTLAPKDYNLEVEYTTTQTSITFTKFLAPSDESVKNNLYSIKLNGNTYKYIDGLTIKNLKTGLFNKVTLCADYNGYTIEKEESIKTEDIPISIETIEVGPTSVNIKVRYGKSDSEITKVEGWFYDSSMNPKAIKSEWLEFGPNGCSTVITGLQPLVSYDYTFSIYTEDGGASHKQSSFKTKELVLNTLHPKCPSVSTAIVAAETNIADSEPNVGFQWKKYDAPTSLTPSEGYGAVYDGRAEGYLRNLQPVYYNVRAFYKANNGTYYYGDWVTFDQTDFSYFEPTVHTYPVQAVSDYNATLKGYVINGTDDIISQGFEYWINGASMKSVAAASTVSGSDVQTVIAKGQVMVAEVNDLRPGTEYVFRAFVKTSSGTTYGEEQTFTTTNMSGIESVITGSLEREIIGYYDLQGHRYNEPQKGFNIIIYSDGSSQKIYFK